LFLRSNQRVETTGAGVRFVGHARQIERDFDAAIQAMGLAVDLPTLRLGVLTSIPGPAIAAAIAEARPGDDHRFELLFGSERELVGHVAKGRVDLALTLVDRGSERFRERAILSEGYALTVPAGHPLAGEREIAAERLASETMIVRRHCEALSDVSRHFTDRGVRPHFALRSTNDERVLDMIAAGLGLTVMPDCFAHPGVARPRLSGFDRRRTIGWAAAHEREHLLTRPHPLMDAIERRLTPA
jgi:DNA-binding transcriptional LysR family regulator